MQGRAHALLKAKEAELRTAREDAAAALAAELSQAHSAAAAAEARAQQVLLRLPALEQALQS